MYFSKSDKRNNEIKKNTNLTIQVILLILALIIIFQIYVVISNNYKFSFIIENFATIITIEIIVCILIILAIVIISDIYMLKQKDKLHLLNLNDIDNNTIIHTNIKDKIIEGDLKTEGCIRHRIKYIIELPKYKCTIKRFDEQELIGYVKIYDKSRHIIREHLPTSLPIFNFFTRDSIVEYTFEILNKEIYSSFLYDTLKEIYYDISIIDNKVIIRYHLYDNSINESDYEHYDNYYNYDFTINTCKDDNDNITSIIENAEIIYLEIIKQIEELSLDEN